MISQKTVQQIQHAPIAERIQMIELILQSLKQDIKESIPAEKRIRKPFKVRSFNLGRDIHVDRDMIYAERSL